MADFELWSIPGQAERSQLYRGSVIRGDSPFVYVTHDDRKKAMPFTSKRSHFQVMKLKIRETFMLW